MQCHCICTHCYYTVYTCAYSHYSAAIYAVPHCIVTLCSPYTVSLCIVNTVSLISIKLYSIQCHYTVYIAMSIYSVDISL